jgi:selenide,water dikinase
MESIRLTQWSIGAGCGCKIAPATLQTILGNHLTQPDDKKLIVGNHTGDDAAVYDIGNGQCLVSTTDFFTPILDEPFDFGRVAAANAISDVYAMGATPVFALAVLGWPLSKLSPEIASEVIAGGKSICAEAGIVIAGGHSIDIPEPVFGLMVNGVLERKNLKRNIGAKPGDVLMMSKRLGTGMLSTAIKRGLPSDHFKSELVTQLVQLNKQGSDFGTLEKVHAMTDITGFGLIGHLHEMCKGSKVAARIHYDRIPLLPGVKEFAAQFVYPDGTMRNWSAYAADVEGISGESLLVLSDPQTNGGLLIAIDPELQAMMEQEYGMVKIGECIPETDSSKRIFVQ